MRSPDPDSLAGMPGHELVARGLEDLARGSGTIEALLVEIGAPRLRRLGYDIPPVADDPEHRLYALLECQHGAAAHSRYNALIRRLVSFERAMECAS